GAIKVRMRDRLHWWRNTPFGPHVASTSCAIHSMERSRTMNELPLAAIPATEVRVLPSAMANQAYLISVALPFGYDEHLDKTYPVVYLLDANLYFGMVVDMVRAMNIRIPVCDELPD